MKMVDNRTFFRFCLLCCLQLLYCCQVETKLHHLEQKGTAKVGGCQVENCGPPFSYEVHPNPPSVEKQFTILYGLKLGSEFARSADVYYSCTCNDCTRNTRLCTSREKYIFDKVCYEVADVYRAFLHWSIEGPYGIHFEITTPLCVEHQRASDLCPHVAGYYVHGNVTDHLPVYIKAGSPYGANVTLVNDEDVVIWCCRATCTFDP